MKRLLTVALLCLSSWLPAKAQNNLTGLNEIGSTQLHKSIYGDFNGDGLTDFVFIANAQKGQIQLTTYLGRGDGFITSIKNSFLSIDPSWNLVQFSPRPSADFNGDGKQDIAFLANNGNINILFIADGNGDGTFGSPQQINLSVSPSLSFYLLDLNNDHKTDILFNDANGDIVALLGNGDGTFQAPVITSLSSLPATFIVATGDLNGDGFPDLLVNGANYYVALGNGHGGFTSTRNAVDLGPTVQPPPPTQEISANFVGMQDFNQDKKSDLLFVVTAIDFLENTTTNTPLFIPGNGDGTFGTAQPGNPLTGMDPINQDMPVNYYSGGVADFYQNGNYEALLIGGTEYCCELDLVMVSNGIATAQRLSSYSSSFEDLSNNYYFSSSDDPEGLAGAAPLTFGPNQNGFVDENGMLFLFTSAQGALAYLPSYYLNFATAPATPATSTLQFFGINFSDFSSMTAQPPLSVSNQNLTPTNPTSPITSCCSADVTFTPSQSGPFSGVVVINGNNGASPINIPVFAYTGTPALAASPATLNLGYVKVGETSAQSVTLTNTSGSPAYITQIAFLGNIQVSQKNDCTGSITSTCFITVTFAPTQVQSESGTLNITDQNGLTTSVALTGGGYSTGPVLSLGATPLDFSNQRLGTTALKNLPISNTGDQPLVIQSITTSPPFAVSTPCTTIQPGAQCNAVISFQPTTAAEYSQTLTIASNAVNNPQTLPLTGIGVVSSFSASPASLAFGNQKTGVTSAAQQITLKNTSAQPATIASIAIPAAPFAETNTCTGTIASGATCTVSVTATPTVAGTKTLDLVVVDQDNGELLVPATVNGYTLGPVLTATPASISFPGQPIATTSAAQPIILQNTGDLPFQLTSVAISGNFKELSSCGTNLPPGASCNIKVTFTPTAMGQQSGALTLTGTFTGSPQTIPLSGIGTTMQLQITPASLDFGSEFVGVTGLPKTITLSNTGNLPVQVQSVTTTGPFGSLSVCDNAISPGDSCVIGVFFQPTAAGAQTGTLTIADDASGSPQSIQLNGTGSSIDVTASSGSSTSATIQQGGTATYSLAIKGEDGFTGSLAVSCENVPSSVQCTPNPSSIVLNSGTSSSNVVFTVGPVTKSELTPYAKAGRLASFALLFGIFSVSFRRRHRQLRRYLILVLTCGLLYTLSACGGGPGSSMAQSGNPGGGTTQTQSQYVLQATFTTSTGNKVQVPLNLTIVSQQNGSN
jgi:hypothetical protein